MPKTTCKSLYLFPDSDLPEKQKDWLSNKEGYQMQSKALAADEFQQLLVHLTIYKRTLSKN